VTVIELDTAGGAVVRDMPPEQYLRHPALSSSQAKLLVKPGGPARYRWRLEHPEPPKAAFDLGHAAHRQVLGCGEVIVAVDAPDWRTKRAQIERDEARAMGRVPLLIADVQRIADMVDALRAHPVASRVLAPGSGEPEVSLFWTDDAYGVDRRGRVDWLRRPDEDGRLILADYKTCSSADPSAIARAVVQFGYHQQAAWYRELVIGLGLARTAPFLFVFQETTAPYLVHVVELDGELLMMGAERNERALQLYVDCRERGVWPGYNDRGISTVSAPRWAWYEHADLIGGDE
jgi:hypothetical protein